MIATIGLVSSVLVFLLWKFVVHCLFFFCSRTCRILVLRSVIVGSQICFLLSYTGICFYGVSAENYRKDWNVFDCSPKARQILKMKNTTAFSVLYSSIFDPEFFEFGSSQWTLQKKLLAMPASELKLDTKFWFEAFGATTGPFFRFLVRFWYFWLFFWKLFFNLSFIIQKPCSCYFHYNLYEIRLFAKQIDVLWMASQWCYILA